MNKASATPALIVAMITAFAATAHAAQRECSVLLSCVGMERTQSAGPKNGAPDANSGTPAPNVDPNEGSGDDSARSPDDEGSGDDDGANSDQDAPPDTAQPPGCIFQDRPLELLV